MAKVKYSPFTGLANPRLSLNSIRDDHADKAWLYNPNTGVARTCHEVGEDCFGFSIPISSYEDEAAIEAIMNSFNFDKVLSVMEMLNWVYSEGVPSLLQIKEVARMLLCSLITADCEYVATGGFVARKVMSDCGSNYSLEFVVESWDEYTSDNDTNEEES